MVFYIYLEKALVSATVILITLCPLLFQILVLTDWLVPEEQLVVSKAARDTLLGCDHSAKNASI